MIKILVLNVIMNNTEFRGEKTDFLKFRLNYQVLKNMKTDTKLLTNNEPKEWVYEIHYLFFISVHVDKFSN